MMNSFLVILIVLLSIAFLMLARMMQSEIDSLRAENDELKRENNTMIRDQLEKARARFDFERGCG